MKTKLSPWWILPILFATQVTEAEPIKVCGGGAKVYTYVVFAPSISGQELFEYLRTGGLGIFFSDGSGPHHRTLHERQSDLLFTACDGPERNDLEFQLGVDPSGYTIIEGELSRVFDGGGTRIGTVFIDDPANRNMARGGGMAEQYYYECTVSGEEVPVLNNIAFWHTGLDVSAVDGASLKTISRELLAPLRARLQLASHSHFLDPMGENCTSLSQDRFVDLVALTGSYEIHYDLEDPTYGVIGVQ